MIIFFIKLYILFNITDSNKGDDLIDMNTIQLIII